MKQQEKYCMFNNKEILKASVIFTRESKNLEFNIR